MNLGATQDTEELHSLYPSPNSIKVTKLKEVKWAGHVACVGDIKNMCSVLA